MNRWLLGAALLSLALFATGSSIRRAPSRPGVDNDPARLLPGFRQRLEQLFRRMKARGYRPLLWEAYRSPERAEEKAKEGTGVLLSMHTLGAAADIVDEATLPDYWRGSPGFWAALGEEAEALGLTWGGRFTTRDVVHVQAVRISDQPRFRQMTDAERRSYVA